MISSTTKIKFTNNPYMRSDQYGRGLPYYTALHSLFLVLHMEEINHSEMPWYDTLRHVHHLHRYVCRYHMNRQVPFQSHINKECAVVNVSNKKTSTVWRIKC